VFINRRFCIFLFLVGDVGINSSGWVAAINRGLPSPNFIDDELTVRRDSLTPHSSVVPSPFPFSLLRSCKHSSPFSSRLSAKERHRACLKRMSASHGSHGEQQGHVGANPALIWSGDESESDNDHAQHLQQDLLDDSGSEDASASRASATPATRPSARHSKQRKHKARRAALRLQVEKARKVYNSSSNDGGLAYGVVCPTCGKRHKGECRKCPCGKYHNGAKCLNNKSAGDQLAGAALAQHQPVVMNRYEFLQELSRSVSSQAGIQQFLKFSNAGDRPGKMPGQESQQWPQGMDRGKVLSELVNRVRVPSALDDLDRIINAGGQPGQAPSQEGR
jgi:hypothetical protein